MSNKFLREEYGLKETVIDAFSHKIPKENELNFWIDREEELKEWRNIIRKSLKVGRVPLSST